jgi:hypothetical protein
MHLRSLIQGSRPPEKPEVGIWVSSPRTPAKVAIPATVPAIDRPTIATFATFAALPNPETWLACLRSDLPLLPAERWARAADALESLMLSGAIDKALALGWDVRELVGVQRHPPHDHPSRAGLIFSMWPGDSVTDVRRTGAVIAWASVRHIWRRVPLPADGSICLPWELPQ